MDIFSHAMLPLAVFALLRRPLAERLAAGLGAAMPDMDFFLTWLSRVDPALWFTVHRGWSHTIWGAPLLAVLGLWILTRPRARAWWPRLGAFEFSAGAVAAASLGSLSHLALVALTITGVPAFWPWTSARWTLNVFFYSVVWMTPVALFLTWRLYRGRLGDDLLRRGAALLAAILLVSGALALASRPPATAAGEVVVPTPSGVRWIVAVPLGNAWQVQEAGIGAAGSPAWYAGNASAAAAEAIRAAESLGTYTAWAWIHPTPLVNATPLAAGWRVEFRDATALHRAAHGGFLAGAFREDRPLVVEVTAAGARVLEQPVFFGLDAG